MASVNHTNLLCSHTDLHTEADVEALFVERLLRILRYPDNRIHRKEALDTLRIPRGSQNETYRPDYVLFDNSDMPRIIFDAKKPNQDPNNYRYQVAGYALGLNSRYSDKNPVHFVVVSSGIKTIVWKWDDAEPVLSLNFSDFDIDNINFIELRSLLSYGAIEISEAVSDIMNFHRPKMDKLLSTFDTAHQLIWKKEKLGPTDAFYEFAKLIFVKLREDQRISRLITEGRTVNLSDLKFSRQWIHQQQASETNHNPIADILFEGIRKDLEISITEGEKKRIFDKDEKLKLKPSTISEIVALFENYNLHGIDEDLNGRMFETFLNATVRGKELGQFFTPRSVVKYMAKSANLKVTRNETPRVLDACCGSGGFLIEAMAVLTHQVNSMNQLTDNEYRERIQYLQNNCLYGIEANDKVTRVARLNMYLHGDGGSRIYTADSLDKDMIVEQGADEESTRWLKELKSDLTGKTKVLFDVILTNPPFSMSYKRSDKREKEILNRYDTKLAKGNSVKSNILFIERYLDLLSDKGELLTVIDNTVLNGTNKQHVRDYIMKHFIILQIVSLPFNTFFRAQANVQTSILHLRRKEPDEKQGDVFMGILNNVGHDDHQRHTPDRDNTIKLFRAWEKWNQVGQIQEELLPNESIDENLACPYQVFIVKAEKLCQDRLDAFYYAPVLNKTRNTLEYHQENGDIKIVSGGSLNIVKPMTSNEIKLSQGSVFRYFEIGDITKDGQIISWREEKFENLPTRARLRVADGDVIFAKNNSSRGKTVIIPPEFDGQLASTGFIAIRPKNRDEAFLLWSIMTSDIFKTQVYYLAVSAVQPEIRKHTFENEFMLPIPKNSSVLIEKAKEVYKGHTRVRLAVKEAQKLASEMFDFSLP